jgi:DNA-binding PadR family transcriptional regulator
MERQLNATAASLLGFLHEGPMTGYDLIRTAELVIGDFWSLTRSQVYRELAAMAQDGLIEAGETGARATRPYALTDAGREAFARWLATEPPPETIRFPLLLAVVFGRHLPEERLAAFVAAHRPRHERKLAEYRALADEIGDEPYARATLDFGLRYEQAVLDWFDALPFTP